MQLQLDYLPVAADKITLEVRSREITGTRAVKRLRRTGVIPGVVYGGGTAPRPILVDAHDLRAALTTDQGRNAILHVSIDGSATTPAILKDFQTDPLRDKLRHIDLLEIALDKPITSNVTVVLAGESPGAKIGGALNQLVHQVRVQAIPTEIPVQLPIDISNLQVGGMLRIADIKVPAAVTVLDDPETIVVAVSATRRTQGIAPVAAAPAAAEAAAEPAAAEADEAPADDAAEE